MIYFVELWNAKPAWKAMSQEERGAYMQKVGAATQAVLDQGVECLTWSVNDEATSKRAGYDYMAIWTFPNQEVGDIFQNAVQAAGWYDYFEQVNSMGAQDSPENVIGKLIGLPSEAVQST